MALPLTHKRILIVEDEQVFRSVLVGYLASLGAETGEATNGIQALGAVDDFKPDLILCDLAMPEMGGIEFVEHLRLQGLQIPVLVISATDKMADIAKVLRLGVQDVLLKPLTDLNRLREAVLACVCDGRFTVCSLWPLGNPTMVFMDLQIVVLVLSRRNLAGFFTASSLLAERRWWWGKDYSSLRSSPFGPR